MKYKRVTEEVCETNRLCLEDLIIGDKKHSLIVENQDGKLCLYFDSPERAPQDADFTIRVEEKGLRFFRCVYRPHHDHNDRELLCEKNEKFFWTTRVDPEACYQPVPFGSKTVSY